MIKRMTISEYNLRSKAYALSQVDRTQSFYIAAWAQRAAQAADKDGKYIYRTIPEAFDAQAAEKEVLHPQPKEPEMDPELERRARRLMRYHQQKKGGVKHE